jgi:putative transposase
MVLPESSTFCKDEYALKQDNVIGLKSPGVPSAVSDALTDLLRDGARQMLAVAVEAEVQEFLARHHALRDDQGRQRVVRNGYLPERTIQTGLGDIDVKAPRVRDRAKEIKFSSAILPPYLRRTKTIEELLPWLYLKGVSTGDFSEALTALLGRDAPGLSASTISRLKDSWTDEHGRWSRRSLVNKHYVYLWVDGVHFGVRLEDASQCMLVVIGATADGKKELVAIGDGYRKSEASWKEVLLDLKARGLKIHPELAIGDGALVFWKALPQVFGHTQGQRCWVRKTANVLNKLPKSQQPKAKAALPRFNQRLHGLFAVDHFGNESYTIATQIAGRQFSILLAADVRVELINLFHAAVAPAFFAFFRIRSPLIMLEVVVLGSEFARRPRRI